MVGFEEATSVPWYVVCYTLSLSLGPKKDVMQDLESKAQHAPRLTSLTMCSTWPAQSTIYSLLYQLHCQLHHD